MAKRERQKRSSRQARQKKRAELEAAHEASAGSSTGTDKSTSPAKASEKKPAKEEKKPGRIRSYFAAVRAEMHRVVWPSRQELRNYTVAVTVFLVIFGVCIWLVDTGVVALLVGFTGLRG